MRVPDQGVSVRHEDARPISPPASEASLGPKPSETKDASTGQNDSPERGSNDGLVNGGRIFAGIGVVVGVILVGFVILRNRRASAIPK